MHKQYLGMCFKEIIHVRQARECTRTARRSHPNDHKVSVRHVWTNSIDFDQTSTLFAIPSVSVRHFTLW